MTMFSRLGFVAALVACGGGGGGGNGGVDSGGVDGGDDGLAFEQLDEEYANAFCTKLFACCNDDEAMMFGQLLGFTDEASCKMSFQMDFEAELAELKPRIDAGELVYDGAAAAACVALSNNAGCPDFLLPIGQTACDRVILGKVENGQACQEDVSCSSGYCEPVDQTSGTCKAVPGAGQPCQTLCTEGLTCANATCQTPKADGATCEVSAECASGHCEGTCQPETTCDGNDSN